MGTSMGAAAISYAESVLRGSVSLYELAKKDVKSGYKGSLTNAIEDIEKHYDDLLKLSENCHFGFFERRKYQKILSKMQQLHEKVHQL